MWPPPRGLMPYPGLLHPEPLPLQQSRHSNTVLSQSLWGLWVLVCKRFVWALWASLAGMGFDSKHNVDPPTVLLGLLLCPWTWGILLKVIQVLPSCRSSAYCLARLLCPWTWLIFSQRLQHCTAVHLSKQSTEWALKLKTEIIKENVNFHCTWNTKGLTHSCVFFFHAMVFPWMFQYRLWISWLKFKDSIKNVIFIEYFYVLCHLISI